MKKLLLVGPHNPNIIRTGQYLSPPLGAHRLAAYLSGTEGLEIKVVDPTMNYPDFVDSLKCANYDYIGFSVLHTTFENDVKNIFLAKKLQPDAKIIAGGQGASFNFEPLLKKTPVSIIVRGFGEEGLKKIISAETDSNLDEIHALYIKRDEKILQTKLNGNMDCKKFREISTCLKFEDIPYEDYWKFMEKMYSKNDLEIMKNNGMLRTIRLITSNYCPLGCKFCSSTNFLNESSAHPQKVYSLDSEDIIHMMKQAIKAHPHVEAFYFNDDDFLLSKNRLGSFLNLAAQFNRRYNLMCMSRVDDVNEDLLKRMNDIGFKIIFYGVESFSNRLAKDMNKSLGDYASKAIRAVRDSLKAGLTPQMSLILFYPTSNLLDLESTIDTTVELMNEGAISTVFPYVEAYSGAKILSSSNVVYSEFNVEGNEFKMASMISPEDKNVREVATQSLALKDRYLGEYKKSFKQSYIAQPISVLYLFKSVYETIGKSTSKIDSLLNRLKQEKIN